MFIYFKPYCTDWQFSSSGYLHEPIQHVNLSKKLLQAPGEAFGTALFGMLEVVAGIPGEGGLDAGFLQQGVLLFDAGADGAHDGVAGLVFAVAEAQVDDACLWFVGFGVIEPAGEPDGRRWRRTRYSYRRSRVKRARRGSSRRVRRAHPLPEHNGS